MWKEMKLGDICSFQNGRAFKKSEWSKDGLPIIRIQNLKKNATESNFYNGHYEKNIFIEKGDLLLSWSGTIKPFIWNHGPALLNQHVFKVLTSKLIEKSFAYYLFQNFIFEISKQKVGIGLQHITKKTFENFKIFLPSICDQQSIVTKLDAAFAQIDKNINNIQNKKNEISILRANIIKERFKESSENIQKYFSEVCSLKRGYDLPKIKRKQGKFPLLSANGITDYIYTYKIKGPGVVTGRSGTIGKVHFIEKDFHPLNTALYVKDFKGNFEKYIYYLLTFFDLKRFSSGAGVPTLNRNVLSNEIVFINPNRNIQIKTSEKLDSLELEIGKILSIMIKKEELYQLLKSSILSSEFESCNK